MEPMEGNSCHQKLAYVGSSPDRHISAGMVVQDIDFWCQVKISAISMSGSLADRGP